MIFVIYDPAGSGNYTVLKHLSDSEGSNPAYGHLIAVEENVLSANVASVAQGFRLYPNPSTGELSLELSAYHGRNVRIEVYNVQGQLLHFKGVDRELVQAW